MNRQTPSKSRVFLWNTLAVFALLFVGMMLVKEISGIDEPLSYNLGTVRVAYELHYPYQYEIGEESSRHLSGLDIELLREAFRRAGYDVLLVPMSWSDALHGLQRGTVDVVSLAFRSPQREAYAYFSDPMFSMRTAVFHRRDLFSRQPQDLPDVSKLVREKNLVVGHSRDYVYPDPVEALLDEPGVKERIQEGDGDVNSLSSLMDGTVDVAMADQLGGISMLLKNGWQHQVRYLTLDVPEQDACAMFSKASVKPELVAAFNRSLAQMNNDGTRARIVRGYYYPTMVSLLTPGFLFNEIAVLAAAAAAISGIFMARKVGTTILGALLLAAAPAVGGGLIRDLIAGRRPVGIVADPNVLLIVFFLVIFAFLVFRAIDKVSPRLSKSLDNLDVDTHPVLIFFDALGLGAFTVFGVLIAMQLHCEPLWLWGPLLAAATNGGGSALRDVILSRPIGMVRNTQLYLEVSIAWGWLLSCFLTFGSESLPSTVLDLQIAICVTMVGVVITFFALRLSGVRSPVYGVLPDHAKNTQLSEEST